MLSVLYFAQNWQKLHKKQKKQLVSNCVFSFYSARTYDYIILEIHAYALNYQNCQTTYSIETLTNIRKNTTPHEKCPYLKFFWSVFSCIRTKYGPEELQIHTTFTQRNSHGAGILDRPLVAQKIDSSFKIYVE